MVGRLQHDAPWRRDFSSFDLGVSSSSSTSPPAPPSLNLRFVVKKRGTAYECETNNKLAHGSIAKTISPKGMHERDPAEVVR
jgi:hypothetical protein